MSAYFDQLNVEFAIRIITILALYKYLHMYDLIRCISVHGKFDKHFWWKRKESAKTQKIAETIFIGRAGNDRSLHLKQKTREENLSRDEMNKKNEKLPSNRSIH